MFQVPFYSTFSSLRMRDVGFDGVVGTFAHGFDALRNPVYVLFDRDDPVRLSPHARAYAGNRGIFPLKSFVCLLLMTEPLV